MSKLVSRATLKDQALDYLRENLINGGIKAGEIYSVTAMAEHLGTSTGPVREAMLTLVEQNLMEAVPNRGFRVVSLAEQDLEEIRAVRLMLEVPAMVQLTEQGIGEHEVTARRHAEACHAAAATGDVTEFLAADHKFHMFLLGLLNNSRLSKFVEQLREQSRMYALQFLSEPSRMEEAAREHAELLDALASGDPKRAASLMTHQLG